MFGKIDKIVFALIIVFVLSVNCFADSEIVSDTESEELPNMFSEFVEISKDECIGLIDNGKIESVAKNLGNLYLVTIDGDKFVIADTDEDITPYLQLKGFDIPTIVIPKTTEQNVQSTSVSTSGIFFVIIAVGFGACFAIAIRKRMNGQAVTVTKSQVINGDSKKDENVPVVKFADVEGVEELKNDVFRLVDCLKNPEKYEAIGARTPKGVILYGPPGTGKTLLAKAIAGEAGVPFISAVGSDFVEKYVGVGAKRVRELYNTAKKKAPCIVFIDEVDAVASQRGNGENSESDQTINALLAELDGFNSTAKIITICATNRLDLLDSAFKRAGRFDLKLAVGLPDKKARHKILSIHSKNKKFSDDVNFETISGKTAGFSGAELEALLNEAAMAAVGKEHTVISNEDIDDAFFKIVMQGNKKPREKITQMNKIVAWHEAGHTLATKLLTEDSVTSVTIIGSSSGAGGVTFRSPKHEGLQSKKYLRDTISIMYAGRVAEEIFLGDEDLITNGASQDIKQATSVIKEYLALYGMGDIGMLDVTQLRQDFGDIMNEASRLAKDIYASTLQLLRDNEELLRELAETLLEKETLNEDEIDILIEKYV